MPQSWAADTSGAKLFHKNTDGSNMKNATAAKAIKGLRDKKAWTQEQLAEIARVSVRTVQRAEEGTMSAETLMALASALEVESEVLSTPPESSYPTITPVLYYQHPATLDWLEKVFGLKVIMRYIGEDGRIQHAELSANKGRIMVGQPLAERGWTTPKGAGLRTQSLYIMVDDLDQHYHRATSQGAEILSEPQDIHGQRRYLAQDPEGHHWWFAAPLENKA